MSPKSTNTFYQKPTEAMIMHRRRSLQRSADGAAVRAASADAAVAIEDVSFALVGQELVLASQALVATGQQETGQRVGNQQTPARGTPAESHREGFQTPSIQGQTSVVNDSETGSNTNVTGLEVAKVKKKRQSGGVPNQPVGSPVAFTPPVPEIAAGPALEAEPVLPLFTPEQIQSMERLRNASPLLRPVREQQAEAMASASVHPPGGGNQVHPGGQLDLPSLPNGSGGQEVPVVPSRPDEVQRRLELQPIAMDQGLREIRGLQQNQMVWQAKMESSMESMLLQLRASQAENQRLKDELLKLHETKDSSRFATPDGRESVGGSFKENGARAQQGSCNKEVGTRVQQDLHCEEEGAEAQPGFVTEEDGSRDQQAERFNLFTPEDAYADQQAQSEEEEGFQEDGPAGRQGSRRGSRSRGSQREDGTIEVMLQLMKGMQALQERIVDREERGVRMNEDKDIEELVRGQIDLHALPEWSADNAPVDFSDWLLLVSSQMADLSASSGQWWETMVQESREWYRRHQAMKPLEKLKHAVKPSPELQSAKWRRLEKRSSTLLLKAIPPSQKEDLVASKDLSVMNILCRLMLNYQPGGYQEKQAVLLQLESPNEATSIAEGIVGLRKWSRWRKRAEEVGVTLPDPTVLLRGLDKLMGKVLLANSGLNFRINLARTTLMIDSVPTLHGIEQYAECLLAELDQMSYSKKKGQPGGASNPPPNPKAKKLEGEGQGSQGQNDEKLRQRGKPKEEAEQRKQPCKFYLTDQGCRRGKTCPYGHVLDQEKRCWHCGAKDHFANSCTRGEEKSTAKAAKAVRNSEKEKGSSAASASSEAPGKKEEVIEEDKKDDAMKVLLEEANRMLKNIGQPEVQEKVARTRSHESRLADLQKELEELRKIQLKPFRISKLAQSPTHGLLDSGATHPLRGRRKGEKISHFPQVQVTLAGDKQVPMKLSPTGVIIGEPGTEPIVPMGMITELLGCKINWDSQGLQVHHPVRGRLDVTIQDGCPVIPQTMALNLIEEIESKAVATVRSLKLTVDEETGWIKQLVESHPVFSNLPRHIKDALVEPPSQDLKMMGNRRSRKLWRRKGMSIHCFSGENSGYHLKRAFHEIGGDRRLIYEMDKLHGGEVNDLGTNGEAYPMLLRAALDGLVKAWIGGPPCRTRSMLRHLPIPDAEAPRPLREWSGGEFGIEGLKKYEKDQVEEDDILLFRFLFLYVVSDMTRRTRQEEQPTGLLVEQPADLEQWPQVVTLWGTPEWKLLCQLHGLRVQRFDQSEFGAEATKPTCTGGTLPLHIPMKGRKGKPRQIEGKSKQEIFEDSRRLARWPPAMMRSIAEAIQKDIFHENIKIRQLSWEEHLAAGHTPFRRDCQVCQQASARDKPHRRSPLPPRAGVLSLDLSGPFKQAQDINSKKAKFLLVGCFTWIAKDQTGEDTQDADLHADLEAPDGAPALEDEVVPPPPEPEEGEEPRRRRGRPRNPDPEPIRYGRHQDPPLPADPLPDGQEEERRDAKIEVHRICVPIPSKLQHDVLRAIVDIYLRLKADGYHVVQLHSDQGGEFTFDALDEWARARNILKTTTPGDSPQTNGRAEVSVQLVKSAIRRILHGSEVGIERWPLAARFLNEKLRLRQIGKVDSSPPFLAPVLIRKRHWRAHELEPTQELVKYIGPSWLHHGHWIERPNGELQLTRVVMKCVNEPPQLQDWIGIEDALHPMDERRRIRGKIAVSVAQLCQGLKKEDEEGEEDEDEERKRRMKEVISSEMVKLMEDEDFVVETVYGAVAALRELRSRKKSLSSSRPRLSARVTSESISQLGSQP